MQAGCSLGRVINGYHLASGRPGLEPVYEVYLITPLKSELYESLRYPSINTSEVLLKTL